ncbi:ankyrin repeat domain-containing protein [Roseospirillum parvum]|uniref:Ankyrin repeat n=1 Tax=Roseospirillum parvum TaxID=83401 RepID=A0A1G7WV42_9PROT|nr:ankyrin repeat domain-containing protein [Roseospirillum parvum]SDG75744.1 Ankyrin repeat [Roseospirillum parvum]
MFAFARLTSLLLALGLGLAAPPAIPPAHAEMDMYLTNPLFEMVQKGDTSELKRQFLGGEFGGPNTSDLDERTLLMAAASHNRVEVLDLLLAEGAVVGLTDKAGNTALSWAARDSSLRAAERLLAVGADPNHQNSQGLTPLMLAVQADDAALVEALLKAGADPGLADHAGQDALLWARDARDPRILGLLENAY